MGNCEHFLIEVRAKKLRISSVDNINFSQSLEVYNIVNMPYVSSK